MRTQSQNTQRRCGSASGQTGTHAPDRQAKRGEERAWREKAAKLFLPIQRSCLLQERQQGRGRARDTAETLCAASAKSATEQKRGIPNTRERKEGKERKGTHGSFHVSSESWAGSRHKAAEAAERAAWSRRSCLNYNEPSWANSQDV